MIALELFPCSGGLAEGFRRAGVAFDLSFDRDADACDSYEANLGRRPVQLDVRDLLRMVGAGWSPGPVRLLVADPPCAPWSRAGKRRGTADERDMLRETVDLIAALRPAAYLIGNIPGLDDAPHWPTLQEALGVLARQGYCVADYASIDAADHGVPQHRVRPFWYGHLAGPCLRWPAPTHGDPSRPSLPGLGLLPWVTCREALGHLVGEDLGRPVRMALRAGHPATKDRCKIGSDVTRCSSPDDVARTIVCHPTSKGGNILLTRHDLSQSARTSSLDAPALTVTSKVPRRGEGNAMLALTKGHRPNRANEPSQTLTASVSRVGAQTVEWPWDRPSTTVRSLDGRIPPPGHHAEGEQLGPNAIVLSERAAAILQGFPEGWRFAGRTKKSRWSQIGQAVPPPVAEAIARAIVEQLAMTDADERASA